MDQFSSWFPALTTTSLFAIALWLTRSLISTRLTNSVKNEFDSKLEKLRAELRSKEAQIESLRVGAMSGLITRQGALYQRRLDAIDQIWGAVKELDKAKHISSTMAVLEFEICAKESARNPKFRNFIDTVSGDFDPKSLNLLGASLARPFLTPLAWAYYSAFSAVIMSAVGKMQILKIGLDDVEKYLNSDYPNKLLKTVLPSKSSFIDEHGHTAHHHLLDEIEDLLLLELRNIQDGIDADKDNTKRAAEITREAENIMTEMTRMQADTGKMRQKEV